MPGREEEMEASILLSSYPVWLTLKNAPTGMRWSERVCQSQTLWFYVHKSLVLVSGSFELDLTALQCEFGELTGFGFK